MTLRDPASPGTILIAATGRTVVGADQTTGKIIWKYAVGTSKETGLARIGLHGDRVIVARDHALRCLDQRTGAVVWKAECPISAQSLIVSPTGRIFVARGGEVACFDDAGKLLWHELIGGEGPVSLAVEGIVLQADEVDPRYR